jgi:DNA-binding NarL/FixJ family response regulator
MIRIQLADDHALIRRGLRELLETHIGWSICGEANDGREAVELALTLAPDVVILDLSMPVLNGIEATRRIREALPRTEVLIYSMHNAEHLVEEVLAAGARGYVLKSEPPEQVIAAIEALLRQLPFLTPAITGAVLDGYLRTSAQGLGSPDRAQRLTSREREVLQLLAEGRSNKNIAAALDISPKTVETHRAAIMRTTGLHSLADLVRYAIRNGFVEA